MLKHLNVYYLNVLSCHKVLCTFKVALAKDLVEVESRKFASRCLETVNCREREFYCELPMTVASSSLFFYTATVASLSVAITCLLLTKY